MAQLAEGDTLVPQADADSGRREPRATPLRLQIFADSSDADLATEIARRLSHDGHEIFGAVPDRETIDAIIVIWSEAALKSPAMLAAARAAQTTTQLIPVSVGAAAAPPDFPEPAPMPLDGWIGDPADPRWRFVIDELSLVALRRGPPAFLRRPADDFHPNTDDLLAADRRTPPTPVRSKGPDARTLIMGAAAIILFAIFALLPPRAEKPVTAASQRAPAAAAAAASLTTAPAAAPDILYLPAEAPVSAPAAQVATPGSPALAQLSRGFSAPSPSLKPKRAPRRTSPAANLKRPSVKPTGAVDPLAALIVETTGKGAAKGPSAFKDCADCPSMLRVAPGKLASTSERQVAVARPFALGAQEVTFAEWDACVIDGGCRAYRPSDSGFGRGGKPVINVSFQDATAYADWLSSRTGARYRLPTDEEWTFAAASGGSAPLPGANAPAAAHRVPADAHGARGLLGNVWEWTADCANWDPSGACAARVVKGGAWNTGDWRKTPRHRIVKPEDERDFDIGFRVARDL